MNRVTKALPSFFVATMLLSCGPTNGGGSAHHHAPVTCFHGESMTPRLVLSVWGGGPESSSSRHRDVVCHYRLQGETQFSEKQMKLIGDHGVAAVYSCEIPGTGPVGSKIEYYFAFKLDGHANDWRLEVVPIVARTENAPAVLHSPTCPKCSDYQER